MRGISHNLFGRRVITCDIEALNDANILDALREAMAVHAVNRTQIGTLYDYYCGKQRILRRTKKVRKDICNRIVENRANEIVSFKVGYLCGEPIQYIGRGLGDAVSDGIAALGELMFEAGKASQDKRLIEWQMIAGTAYRMLLPQKRASEDDLPFTLDVLDPRDTFVVYKNDIGQKPLFACKYAADRQGVLTCSVYSDRWFWRIRGDAVIESLPHSLGMVPIFEYPANSTRLGSFEIVMDLLDALNNIASNRMDGIEQFVQSFMKFVNCDIDEDNVTALQELGAIKIKSVDGLQSDVSIISSELNQSQTQITKDDVYEAILTICGMPNRNGGSSTSDTGAAVIMRDGWSDAEARAKESELSFKESEIGMLRLLLRILRDTAGVDESLQQLKLSDIDIKFTRRHYDNIQSRVQVLDTMLKNEKIHPRLAFTQCGLFADPENAYQLSMDYREEQSTKEDIIREIPGDREVIKTQTDREVMKTQGETYEN